MRRLTLSLLVGLLATGCGYSPISLPSSTSAGLPATVAATYDVESSQPNGFVLTTSGQAFVSLLKSQVEPLRQTLAQRILTDPTIMAGLQNWSNSSATDQLNVLEAVAKLEASVMNISVPPITSQSGAAPSVGEIAQFAPTSQGIGQVTLYPDQFAQGSAFAALDAVVHEMRHAAQYQLVLAAQQNQNSGQTNQLAAYYAGSWAALSALGSEDNLSYGDYCHLNVEYDAFQTGNEVATLVSGGQLDTSGYGFVDVQFTSAGQPVWDLASLIGSVGPVDLVQAVNAAEAAAEQVGAPRHRHRSIGALEFRFKPASPPPRPAGPPQGGAGDR